MQGRCTRVREFCISGAWGIMLSCLDGKGRTNVRVGYSQKGCTTVFSFCCCICIFENGERWFSVVAIYSFRGKVIGLSSFYYCYGLPAYMPNWTGEALF